MPYKAGFAAHALGFYPVGYWNTSDQETMPLEESGDMLCMLAAAIQRRYAALAISSFQGVSQRRRNQRFLTCNARIMLGLWMLG